MSTVTSGWQRARPTPRQVRTDAVLAALMIVVAVVSTEITRSAPYMVLAGEDASLGWRGVEAYLWAAAMALPLVARRVAPISTLLTVCAAFYVLSIRFEPVSAAVGPQICLAIAIYSSWAWSRRRRVLLAVTLVLVAALTVWLGLEVLRADPIETAGTGLLDPMVATTITAFAINAIYFGGAVGWGEVAWRSARQRAVLEDQAEQLRREQQVRADRAVADERVRIARDLHDVVAHHVSGIGVQAAGARRLLQRDLEASGEALRTIEGSSRSAVTEMHRLVGLLREPDGETADGTAGRAPQPGLPELRRLGETASSRELTVVVREVGDPLPVASTVALSLFRTAQEAVTNIVRHSTATSAEVVLRWLPPDTGPHGHVEVEVLDEGRPRTTTAADASTTGGWGLRGIRERAAVHDGETDIGSRITGGFRVRVRLPAEPSDEGTRT